MKTDPTRRALLSLSMGAVAATSSIVASSAASDQAGDSQLAGDTASAGVQDSLADIRRYGAVGDGQHDDTPALREALKAAAAGGHGVDLVPGGTHAIAPVLVAASSGMPLYVRGRGTTLRAIEGGTRREPLLTIENPQGRVTGFELSGLTLDAAGRTSSALLIHGCQRAVFRALTVVGATGPGIELHGEPGFGIYYNVFESVQAGAHGQGNRGSGWFIHSRPGGFHVAANVLVAPRAQFNGGDGFTIDWANNTFLGIESEKNDGFGVRIDNCYSNDFFGGYTEHNHQGFASADRLVEGTPDRNFAITTASTGVKVLGGRMIGEPVGEEAWAAAGNLYLPGNAVDGLRLEPGGKLHATTLRLSGQQAGIGLGGATPQRDAINFAGPDASLQIAGNVAIALAAPRDTGQTALLLRYVAAGGVVLQRVTVGAPDSAGTGFRMLMVPN